MDYGQIAFNVYDEESHGGHSHKNDGGVLIEELVDAPGLPQHLSQRIHDEQRMDNCRHAKVCH